MNSPILTQRRQARVLQAALVGFLLLLWDFGIRFDWLAYVVPNPTFWFSSPEAVGSLVWRLIEGGQLARHLGLTLGATLAGLAIGAVLGIIVGLVMAVSRDVELAFEPIWAAFNALPKIALAPALVAALGIGLSSKVAIAVAPVFPVFLFNTIAGLKDVSVTILNSLKLMNASRMQVLRMLVLPTLVRWHYGALRISLGLALTGVVVGEFVAARGGVGFIIQYGFGTFNVTWCYAGIFVLAALALATDAVLRIGQRWLTPWQDVL